MYVFLYKTVMLRHCHLVTIFFTSLSREYLRSRENFAKKEGKLFPTREKALFSQYLIVLDNTAATRTYSSAWKVDMFARTAAPWNIFSRFFV